MKVTVEFKGTGLQLILHAETEVEQRMVGAVLNNQPSEDTSFQVPIDQTLVRAELLYQGHHTHRRVDRLVLTVHRQEQP